MTCNAELRGDSEVDIGSDVTGTASNEVTGFVFSAVKLTAVAGTKAEVAVD